MQWLYNRGPAAVLAVMFILLAVSLPAELSAASYSTSILLQQRRTSQLLAATATPTATPSATPTPAGPQITLSSSTATGIALAALEQYLWQTDQRTSDDLTDELALVNLAASNAAYKAMVNTAAASSARKEALQTSAYLTKTDYSQLAAHVHSTVKLLLKPRASAQAVGTSATSLDKARKLRRAFNAVICSSFPNAVYCPVTTTPLAQRLLPGLNELRKLKRAYLDDRIQASAALYTNQAYGAYNPATSHLARLAKEFARDTVKQANDLAHNDPQYAGIIDPLLQAMTGFNTRNLYKDVALAYPGVIPTLTPNPDGSLTFSAATVLTQYNNAIASVQNATNCSLGLTPCPTPTPALSPATASYHAVITKPYGFFDTISSVVSGASDLLGAGDPQTGQCADAAGSSSSDIGSYISTAVTIAALFGRKITSPSSLSIVPLPQDTTEGLGISDLINGIAGDSGDMFSGIESGDPGSGIPDLSSGVDGPTDCSGSAQNLALISGQITQLSNQLSQFQKNVNTRLDKIDQTLSTVLTTLNANFSNIEKQLNTISVNLATITGLLNTAQVELVNIQSQLYVLQEYLQAEFADLQNQSFRSNIVPCLEARASSGIDIDPNTDSNTYENCQVGASGGGNGGFFFWAMSVAVDNTFAPTTFLPTDYTSNIYGVMDDASNTLDPPPAPYLPVSAAINYLSALPANNPALSGPMLFSSPLPNPDQWALGARAYLQMASEWPEHELDMENALSFDPISMLIDGGVSLVTATKNTTTSVYGGQGTLFQAVEAKYFNDWAALFLTDILNNAQSQPAGTDYCQATYNALTASPATPILKAAQLVTGDRDLLRAYGGLAWSNALQTDDQLRAPLFGCTDPNACPNPPGLPDLTAVESYFHHCSFKDLSSFTTYVYNQYFPVVDALGPWGGFWSDMELGVPVQPLDEIDNTLADLQNFELLKNAGLIAPCTAEELSAGGASFNNSGGSGVIGVMEITNSTECKWAVTTNASWVKISPPASGMGNGRITFSVAPNPSGLPRDAIIIVGDKLFHVGQSDGSPVRFRNLNF